MRHPNPTRPTRFQAVALTPARLDQFHEYTHEALKQTVREFVRLGGESINAARWRLHRSRDGVSVYSDRRSLSAHLSSLLVAGTIRCRLTDIMEGLYMDTSEATHLTHRQLSARFVDAEVLKVIERRSIDRPFAFTGIKWAMLKSSSSGIVSNRDICFFEKLGTIDIADGRKLGYFIMQSVDIPECPPAKSRKVVRADISLCYLFEELRNGVVGVYMRGNMESYGPQVLWKMARSSFADIAVSISNAVAIAHAKKYTRLMQAKRLLGWSHPTRSIVCESCRALPSFFDHYEECAGCSKASVCKKCRVKCDVLDCDRSPQRLLPATFCIDCVRHVHSPPKRKPLSPQRYTRVVPRIHEPIPEPIQRANTRASVVDERVRFDAAMYDSYMTSFQSVTADETSEEHAPDSQQSLREFSLKLAQQLEDAGYSESDVSLRLTDLTTLGTGSIQHDHATHDRVEEPMNHSEVPVIGTSSTPSGYSVSDDDSDEHDARGKGTSEQDEAISIQPLRRSTQPPEMLERQTLNRDGSIRLRPQSFSDAALTYTNERAKLMSRLLQASIAAEQTFRLTREQSRHANHIFEASRGRPADQ